MTMRERLPGIDVAVGGGPLGATIATRASADSAVSSTMKESLGPLEMTLAVDPKAANPSATDSAQPFNASARFESATLDFNLDGLKPRPLLDLWAFIVAHPTRPELAADEAAFKTLLTAALADRTALDEEFGLQKLSVQTPKGLFTFDGAKVGVSVAAAGPASRFEQHYVATGLALPPGLVPAPYQDLVPTSFDLGFKVSGFDLTAAGTEAIADMHLAGDAPPIAAEDEAKVSAKLQSGGPVVIDIPSSHIRAPQLDVSFEGQVHYLGPKSTGTITVHARNFDQTTAAALKAGGPEGEKKLVPLVAMVKGLCGGSGYRDKKIARAASAASAAEIKTFQFASESPNTRRLTASQRTTLIVCNCSSRSEALAGPAMAPVHAVGPCQRPASTPE